MALSCRLHLIFVFMFYFLGMSLLFEIWSSEFGGFPVQISTPCFIKVTVWLHGMLPIMFPNKHYTTLQHYTTNIILSYVEVCMPNCQHFFVFMKPVCSVVSVKLWIRVLTLLIAVFRRVTTIRGNIQVPPLYGFLSQSVTRLHDVTNATMGNSSK